jgi:hypothetical protein
LRRFRYALLLQIGLIIYICFNCVIAYGYLPAKNSGQLIAQREFVNISSGYQKLINQKLFLQCSIANYKELLSKIHNNSGLTAEQKAHRLALIENVIRRLQEWANYIPTNFNTQLLITCLEYGVSDYFSVGAKAIIAAAHHHPRAGRIEQMQIFSKWLLWHKNDFRILIAPSIAFAPNSIIEAGMRVILFQQKKPKGDKPTKFREFQVGCSNGAFGLKYFFELTDGVKFNNGAMVYWQSFLLLDRKNPILLFRKINKNQITVAKKLNKTPVTLQTSYFMQHSLKPRVMISTGFVLGCWLDF